MTVYLLPDRTQAIELARTLNCQQNPLPEHIAFIFVTTEPEKVHPKLLASVSTYEDAA